MKLFYGWIVVAAGMCFSSAYGFYYSYGLFFLPVLADFHLTHGTTSSIYSLALFGWIVGTIIGGRMTNKVSCRTLNFFGSLLFVSGALLSSLAQNVYELYLTYGVIGAIGWGLFNVASNVATMRWFSKKRVVAFGVQTAGAGVGTFVIPIIVGYSILSLGWRAAFLWLGIGMLPLLALASYATVSRPEEIGLRAYGSSTDEQAARLDSRVEATVITRSSVIWVLFTAFFLACVTVQGYAVHVVPYATQTGMSGDALTLIVPTFGLSSLLGRLAIPQLAEKLGRMYSLLFLYLLLALAILFSMELSSAFIYLGAAVAGLSFGGFLPTNLAVVGDVSDPRQYGANTAIISIAFGFGGIVGPLTAGYLHDLLGNYVAAFWLFAALSFSSALLIYLRRRGRT
jgi:MFS transporter, OFA family, oxalate/formate antiporter